MFSSSLLSRYRSESMSSLGPTINSEAQQYFRDRDVRESGITFLGVLVLTSNSFFT